MVDVVIRMYEEQYEFIKHHMTIDKIKDYPALLNAICEYIANGELLPKGHGRLGDLDKLEVMMKDEVLNHGLNEYGCLDLVKRMQGIIEVDKESDNAYDDSYDDYYRGAQEEY